MSVTIMAEVWKYATDLSGTPLLMLLAVADHCNDDRIAWPSVRHLAEKCRIGERQAQYVLRDLQEQGYLKVDQGRGRARTNVYQITPFAGWRIKGAAECTQTEEKVQSDVKKVQSDVKKVQSDSLKGALAIAPESSLTIIEPSKESSSGGDEVQSGVMRAQAVEYYDALFGNRGGKPLGAKELDQWITCYGLVDVHDALKKSWGANAKSPAYTLKILENKVNGNGHAKPQPAAQPAGGVMERW